MTNPSFRSSLKVEKQCIIMTPSRYLGTYRGTRPSTISNTREIKSPANVVNARDRSWPPYWMYFISHCSPLVHLHFAVTSRTDTPKFSLPSLYQRSPHFYHTIYYIHFYHTYTYPEPEPAPSHKRN